MHDDSAVIFDKHKNLKNDTNSGKEWMRKHIGRTSLLLTAAIRIATWSTVNKPMTTDGDITRASLNSSSSSPFEKRNGCHLPSARQRPILFSPSGERATTYIIANPAPCAPWSRPPLRSLLVGVAQDVRHVQLYHVTLSIRCQPAILFWTFYARNVSAELWVSPAGTYVRWLMTAPTMTGDRRIMIVLQWSANENVHTRSLHGLFMLNWIAALRLKNKL